MADGAGNGLLLSQHFDNGAWWWCYCHCRWRGRIVYWSCVESNKIVIDTIFLKEEEMLKMEEVMEEGTVPNAQKI